MNALSHAPRPGRSCSLIIGLALLLPAFLLGGSRGSATAQSVNLALTPYMGWNSWYGSTPLYEEIVLTIADSMVGRGLLASGYQYVWMDGGWWDGERDERGNIIPPPRQWPHGL